MWDQRYKTDEYIYGTEPNDFLRETTHHLPKGRVLCIAEGEGRNAVYLSKLGYEVTAVDASIEGLHKARRLAAKHNVEVEIIHADLADYNLGKCQWDAIVSIFCPLPSTLRKAVYANIPISLRSGGVFLLEAYTPAQVNNDTGGGKDPDTMQTTQSVTEELHDLEFLHLIETERNIIEGKYHTGMGSVVQAVARKA